MKKPEPINDNVVILPTPRETQEDGILLPATAINEPDSGVVFKAEASNEVELKDEVYYHKKTAEPISIDGVDYLIIPKRSLLTIVREGSFIPLNGNVILIPASKATESNGFLVPETAVDHPVIGTVVAVKGGFDIEVGDNVLYPQNYGAFIEKKGIKYLILHSSKFTAILRD